MTKKEYRNIIARIDRKLSINYHIDTEAYLEVMDVIKDVLKIYVKQGDVCKTS